MLTADVKRDISGGRVHQGEEAIDFLRRARPILVDSAVFADGRADGGRVVGDNLLFCARWIIFWERCNLIKQRRAALIVEIFRRQ